LKINLNGKEITNDRGTRRNDIDGNNRKIRRHIKEEKLIKERN
jgi:hypothetical protein